MWKWLYFNSSTVQAVCAILASAGLAIYAWDTRRIRQATLSQTDASRRPFFELIEEDFRATLNSPAQLERVLSFRNAGVGIALDVAWQPLLPPAQRRKLSPKPKPIGDIAPGGILKPRIGSAHLTYAHIVKFDGIALTYVDGAGKQYFKFFIPTSEGWIRGVELAEKSARLAKKKNRQLRAGKDTKWFETLHDAVPSHK
jgi:hypothetical protein